MISMYPKVITNIRKHYEQLVHQIAKNSVKVYWFDKVPNFGDLLNPILFKHYGLLAIHASRNDADILAIGSNLDKQSEEFTGYIIGAGLKTDTRRVFHKAKIISVRGELTRDRIIAEKCTPLGDPGLLIPFIYKMPIEKKHTIGIVPHYIDKNNECLQMIIRKNKDIFLIDPQRSPKLVVKDISNCQFILSSSLHGLVSAEALGIPNGWIVLSNKVEGNGFKFLDFASAINKSIIPNRIFGYENVLDLIKLTVPCSDYVSDVQQTLDKVFRNFAVNLLNDSD